MGNGENKTTKKGKTTYGYWMASWQKGDKLRESGSRGASHAEGQEDKGRDIGDTNSLVLLHFA